MQRLQMQAFEKHRLWRGIRKVGPRFVDSARSKEASKVDEQLPLIDFHNIE